MNAPHLSRFQKKVTVLTIMLSGTLLISMYILAFSCCAVVMSPAMGRSIGGEEEHPRPGNLGPIPEHRSKVLVLQDELEEETKYQRSLEETGNHNPNLSSFRRKTLLEHGGVTAEDPESPRRHHRQHSTQDNQEDNNISYDEDGYGDNDIRISYDSEDYSSSKHQSDKLKYNNHHRKANNRTHHQSATRKLPQAIIIGVKKGGTRALLEFLRIHPDVRAPGPEPHFFDKNFHKSLEWYRQQMPATLEGQITMEKTPSYFVTKGVPARISNMSRNTKLIVVVRDPVTRAISDYTQALSKRTDIKSFEEMAFEDNSTGLVDTSWGAIRIGVYAKHLERWLQYFPLSQIHFVNGEKLITDPSSEMAKVQDFLGLKKVITDKHFYFNTTKGFPCLKKPEGSGNPHCLGKTKGRSHPKVDRKVLQRLRDFFRPFNQKFYQMVGEDFGWS